MKRILPIVFAVGMAGSLYAQEFKEVLLYEASGPVKQILTESENKLAPKKLKFNKDGKKKGMGKMEFDDQGKPTGFKIGFAGRYNNLSISYDSLSNVKDIILTANVTSSPTEVKVVYTRDGDRISCRLLESFKDNAPVNSILAEFSEIEVDDHGNWTKRTVTETAHSPENPGEEFKRQYTETREITYYTD